MTRRVPLLSRFFLVLLALMISIAVPVAAEPASGRGSGVLADTDVRALVETLDAARKKLIAQLNALIAIKAGAKEKQDHRVGAKFMDLVSERIGSVSDQLVSGADVFIDIPATAGWLRNQVAEPGNREFWFALVWKVALVVALGVVAQWLVNLLLIRPRRAIELRDTGSHWLRVPLLAARTVVDLIPLAAFGAAAYVAMPFTQPDKATSLVALSVVNAILVARVVLAVARAVVVPGASSLRLFSLSDINANYIFLWVRRFTNIGVYGYFLAEASLLLGLSNGGYHAIRVLIGLLIALMAVVLVLQSRDGTANWIRGGEDAVGPAGVGILRRRLGDVWHILAIIYVAALFFVWAVNLEGGFALILQGTVLSIVIITAATMLSRAAHRLIQRGLGIGEETRRRFPGLEARADRYLSVLFHGLRTVLIVIASIAVLQAWGIDAFGWLASDFGRRLAGAVVTIVIIVVLAVLFWEFASSAIERYLARGDTGGPAVSSRARTLLPLLRNALMVTLVILVVMSSLSELGVDIGPLLAGAGILGLAVGFGAQALVKDIITGFFILMEDQIAVGDVIRVGTHGGLVESLTIRTLRLRDLGGNVHIIPFSEVTTVENMTKDFSRYVFDVGVGYREDTDEVAEVLRQIGAEMQAEEYYNDLILEPLDILGVDQFADSAVVIRARFTTKPIKQWEVGREFNRRMKKRFDELGIEIPFPHQTIYFGEDKEGRAPAAQIHMRTEPPERRETRSTPVASGRPAPSAAQRTPDVDAPPGADGGDGD